MANILVIDDEECIRESFKLILEPENSVVIASSGEDGIAKATVSPPDIIFLDLKMPGINGVETMKRLKIICPEAYTFMMTGFYKDNMLKLEEARDDGCLFELCRKPMDSKQIRLVVQGVLGGHDSSK